MEFEMVICIVNSGFSDDVMEAAREVGARGGTVINGRGEWKTNYQGQSKGFREDVCHKEKRKYRLHAFGN